MSFQHRVVALFCLALLCAGMGIAIVWRSPDPMPGAHAQLLAAFIAGFSTTVVVLLRMLGTERNRTEQEKKEGATH